MPFLFLLSALSAYVNTDRFALGFQTTAILESFIVLRGLERLGSAGEKKELLRRFEDCNDFCPDKPFWVWFPASQFACWGNSVITLKILPKNQKASNKKENVFMTG